MSQRDNKPFPVDVRLVAFDVDGVFTDGRFYLCDDGRETKAFSTQDGFGIRRLLDAGIAVAVISGRKSIAVELRMSELGVEHVVQGCSDKVSAFKELLEKLAIDVSLSVYVGDDVPDLDLLRQAGFAVAVANAVADVKSQCDYVTAASGGFGAVREVSDRILEAQGKI